MQQLWQSFILVVHKKKYQLFILQSSLPRQLKPMPRYSNFAKAQTGSKI